MKNNDGYIVEIVKQSHSNNNSLETRYYYKNGKLHREAGPAIVTPEDKEKFSNLGDEHLYKEIYLEAGIGAYQTYFEVVGHVLKTRLFSSKYYLNGKGYSEKGFLRKQLQNEMPINSVQSKKLKL